MSEPRDIGGADGAAVVAGVDEAGLGPILGPLTIGWTAFRLPAPEADPWRLLRRRVSRNPAHDRRRLVVADSKRVFARNERGRRRLELTVLSFLAQRGLRDGATSAVLRDPRALLFTALPPEPGVLERHPWYALLGDLPRDVGADLIELRAAALGRELASSGCELLDAGVRVVPAGELNDSYRATSNKASTVWAKTLEVLRLLWERLAPLAPRVTVDLLGGRVHYGPLLAIGFPEAGVRLLREDDHYACYELVERGSGARRMTLEFASRGEERSFAVALASCLAKYARETVMDAFNAYFAACQPGLRPTAGYRSDGWRWLSEAAPALALAGVPQALLVRER